MDSAPINIQAAKAQFSRLIAEVTEGKEIVLAKAGKPVAKLVPYSPPPLQKREGGFLKGQLWESPDCWEPDEDIIKMMTEGPIFPDEEDQPLAEEMATSHAVASR